MLSNILRVSKLPVVFSTWNPADKGSAVVLSNGNKTAAVSGLQSVRGSKSRNSGILQFEITVNSLEPYGALIGVGTSAAALTVFPGAAAGGWGYYSYNGNKYNEGVSGSYGASYPVGSVIGVKVNFTSGDLEFYKNGVSQGVASTGLAGKVLFPMVGSSSSSGSVSTLTLNVGASAFSYPIPGALPWT